MFRIFKSKNKFNRGQGFYNFYLFTDYLTNFFMNGLLHLSIDLQINLKKKKTRIKNQRIIRRLKKNSRCDINIKILGLKNFN